MPMRSAIDADPAVGLSTALGVHVEHTIDDIRNEVIETSERGEYRQAIEVLNEARFRIFDTMVECDGFAFLAIGRPEAAGCSGLRRWRGCACRGRPPPARARSPSTERSCRRRPCRRLR